MATFRRSLGPALREQISSGHLNAVQNRAGRWVEFNQTDPKENPCA